ncbi:MAG: translation initiation factor IF-3 [Simkaniaceae bacterium]|nr:translation initiation factor IF-3 [Simkaniaceae bacterium]
MRVNRQIRIPRVRLIDQDGKQVGIVVTSDAMRMAEEAGLDLVEISPRAEPPVCKIIDYGKFRYEQTKKEKEQKRTQAQQGKMKEVKCKPNIDEHDYQTKLRHAREFIERGNKVRFSCMFRGREITHPEVGRSVMQRFVTDLTDIGICEAHPKLMGKVLSMVIAPNGKNK